MSHPRYTYELVDGASVNSLAWLTAVAAGVDLRLIRRAQSLAHTMTAAGLATSATGWGDGDDGDKAAAGNDTMMAY